jgi:hypothetical protein
MKKGVRQAYHKAVRTSFLSHSKKVLNMPTAVEAKLRKEAEEKFPGNKQRQDAYIYGTMRKLGWKPGERKSS